MLRLTIRLLGLILLSSTIACSSDDSDDESAAGAAGAGGGGGSAGSGGGSGAPGVASMYTVAQSCALFAAATCAKAAECGLVLDETPTELVCVNCTEAALAIIAAGCEGDLVGPKDAATLDRCLDNVGAASCTDACSDADVPDCQVIGELSGEEGGDPVVCDMACASG